jgi:hypothetical protein
MKGQQTAEEIMWELCVYQVVVSPRMLTISEAKIKFEREE